MPVEKWSKMEFRNSKYYSVSQGKLVRQEQPGPRDPYGGPYPAAKPVPPADLVLAIDTAKFYIHDVKTNTSREIPFAEAEKIALDPRQKSPDGFEVGRNYSNRGIFTEMFGGGGG